jgi:hypothetical protein
MKKILIAILLAGAFSLTSQTARAQNTCMSYNDEEFKSFFSTTTKVALVGNENYDKAIKEAIDQYWTITKVEYFNYSDLVKNKMLKDKSASFLLPFVFNYHDLNFESDDLRVWNFAGTDIWLCAVMGGRSGSKSYTDYSLLSYAPIDNYANEMNMFNCSYRLGLMVKGMQEAIMIVKNNSLKAAPLNQLRAVLKEMSAKAGVLKTKALLVNENIINDKNFKGKQSLTADVLKSYKYTYKVVPQAEIETAIKNKDKQYCYLYPVFASNKNVFVSDLESGEIVYGTYAAKGLDINKDDIAKLNAAIAAAK